MAFRLAARATMAESPESISGMRPITLLIATGIALVTAMLMVIGIAANHLRGQALHTAGSELARIDSLLAAASTASLAVIASRAADLAARLEQNAGGDPASLRAATMPETAAWLRSRSGRTPPIDAIAVLAADGEVLGSVGAWPRDPAVERIAAVDSASRREFGAAIRNPQSGATGIPFIHRVMGAEGKPLGAVVAIVPLSHFTSLFAAVPLPTDAVITLFDANGSEIVRYPEPAVTTPRQLSVAEGGSRMQALQALHAMEGFPATIALSRDAGAVLAEWNHQILWLSAFALFAAVAIGVMIYLIARQFKSHADLATMRADRIEAEKIESERARLAAETELLKSERLSVLDSLPRPLRMNCATR